MNDNGIKALQDKAKDGDKMRNLLTRVVLMWDDYRLPQHKLIKDIKGFLNASEMATKKEVKS